MSKNDVIELEGTVLEKLVKQLLELMTIEYGKREFNDKKFNVVELEQQVIIKSQVMLQEKDAKMELVSPEEINVMADDFYIEQVISNYVTNALKHVKEVNGENYIKIYNEVNVEKNKVRIKVFNTGDNIKEEDMARIWNRFFKADESRNRNGNKRSI